MLQIFYLKDEVTQNMLLEIHNNITIYEKELSLNLDLLNWSLTV
jgi:hypothetical protein